MSEIIPLLQEMPNEQDIGGASGARLFQITAIGKGNSEDFPYNVVNEKIASELARLVGLPVPEVVLMQHRDEWMFFSRAVSTVALGQSKPPGTARDVATAIANWPGITEQMVCLDLFVCNNDRNPGNFLCDSQKQLWLIDYGNALFYRHRPQSNIVAGIPRLEAVEKDLNALFDKPHDSLQYCKSWEAMQRGFERIAAIPDYFIEHTVSRLPRGLVSDEEAEFVTDFLCRRKTRMESIVLEYLQLFSGLKMSAAK